MARPKITLHILTSPNGQITGDFSTPAANSVFERLGFNDDSKTGYNFDGWIYGRNTSDWFSGQQKPDLHPGATVSDGDYVINQGQPRYYISIDRHGDVGWPSNETQYAAQKATVIEILTDQATPEYRDFLRRRHIAYLICGHTDVDFKVMLDKLSADFHLQNLMLGGGGILNWSFLDAGLVDEVSLVISPALDGNIETARLFSSQFSGHSHKISFELKHAQVVDGDVLWVRYRPLTD